LPKRLLLPYTFLYAPHRWEKQDTKIGEIHFFDLDVLSSFLDFENNNIITDSKGMITRKIEFFLLRDFLFFSPTNND